LVKKLPIVPSAKPGSMADAPSGIVWREQHPEIGSQCNQCLECTLFCPEGALKEESGQVVLTLEWCNGCGTCAVECPQKAICMVAEFKGDRGVFPLKEGSK
jgi:pyruvate ferredoxin oxidoreductase delta subunit